MVIKKWLKRFYYLLAGLIIALALMVLLSRAITIYFNMHRAQWQEWINKQLGTDLLIGSLHFRWFGYIPSLQFREVVILDPTTHKKKLRLDDVTFDLDLLQSIKNRRLIAGFISVNGVHLTIGNKSWSKLLTHGFESSPLSDEALTQSLPLTELYGFILSQPKLAFSNIVIEGATDKNEKLSVSIKEIEVVNHKLHHLFTGYFTIEDVHPATVQFHVTLEGDMQTTPLKAHVYLALKDVNLPRFLGSHEWQGLQVHQGLFSGKIWAAWENEHWQKMQSLTDIRQLQLYSTQNKKQLMIPHIEGHIDFVWHDELHTWELISTPLHIQWLHHVWPALSLAVQGREDHIEKFQVSYLKLEDITGLLLSTSALYTWRSSLIHLKPTGEVFDLVYAADAPSTETVKARFQQLTIQPWQRWPGLQGFNATVHYEPKKILLEIEKQPLVIVHSALGHPLLLDSAKAQLKMEALSDGTWLWSGQNIEIANADVNAAGDFSLHLFSDKKNIKSPVIKMRGTFSVPHLNKLFYYLPSHYMNTDLNTWLTQAFQQGSLKDGQIQWESALNYFSSTAKKVPGIFRIQAIADNVNLSVHPQWPIFTDVSAKLMVEGDRLALSSVQSTVLGETLPNTKILIKGLFEHPILFASGTVETDLKKMILYLSQTPLRDSIAKEINEIILSGPAALSLQLKIPLYTTASPVEVDGNLHLLDGDMRLEKWKFYLTHMRGDINFNKQGIHSLGLNTSFFDKPAHLQLSSVKERSGKVMYIRTLMNSQLDLTRLNELSRGSLSTYAEGSAAFNAELLLPVDAHSNLSKQLRVESNLKGVSIHLPSPYNKLQNETRQFVAHAIFSDPTSIDFSYQVDKSTSLTAALKWGISPEWDIAMDNKLMKGRLTVPFDYKQKGINARFDRFTYISQIQTKKTKINPQHLPPINIQIQNFYYNAQNIGQITVALKPVPEGATIDIFSVLSPYLKLKAQGLWTPTETTLAGDAETTQVMRLLNAFNYAQNLKADKGAMNFNLRWPGAPQDIAAADLSGQVFVALGNGQITHLSSDTETKMGMGRVLNLLSLRTVPRRLNLDFTDLFQRGYSFDRMEGRFSIGKGNIETSKTFFDGPVARVVFFGRIGYVAKDYNLQLSVTPYVTSSLPLVATIAGGPIAGAATWVAERVVSRAVSQFTTHHYRITGPWAKPLWTPMDE